MDQREWLLANLLEHSPVAVAIFDRDLILRQHNAAWQELVGRPAPATGELLGQQLFQLLPGSESALAPRFARALNGETLDQETLRLPHHQNDDRYWQVRLSPRVENGQVGQVLMMAIETNTAVQAQQQAERRMADHTRRLQSLYEIMAIASEPLAIESMLERILERALVAVRSQAGAIYLLDQGGERLELIASSGLESELASLEAISPADSGLPGAVVKSREAVIVADIQVDSRTREDLRQSAWRAYAGVPMSQGSRLLGVFSVLRRTNRPFGSQDAALLRSVADQIAVAIENSRLRQKAEELAVAEERSRLARELHDAVTQSLYSISLLAAAGSGLQELITAGREPKRHQALLAETLDELSATARQALKEMRLLLYRLRPLALQQHNLVGALRQRLDAVERRAGLETSLVVDYYAPLGQEVEEAFFQIAQEALNNALRHAQATAVAVHLSGEGNQVVLAVADNGQGFRLDSLQDSGGMGLTSMHERAEGQGGQLTITTAPGQGTRVEARLPA